MGKNDTKSKEQLALEFAQTRQQWKENPEDFFTNVLGINLPPHQKKILRDCFKHNKIAINTANSVGKCEFYNDFSVLGDGTLVKAKDLINKEFNILTYDKNKDIQYSELARAVDNGEKECYQIKLQSGKIITRTHNHPLYKAHLEKTNKRIDGRRLTIEPVVDEWTHCEDLKVGDYILVPKIHQNIQPTKLDFTDEECKILGYLIGDGGTTVNVTFTQEDNKQLCEFIECVERLGSSINNVKKYTYRVIGDGTKKHNPVLNKVKEWGLYGCKSTEKLIPDFVGRLPLNQIALVLNRIYACDGYAIARIGKRTQQKNKNWETDFWDTKIGITLANEDLIKQIRLLLMRFGIEAWCRYKPSKCNSKTFDAWELIIQKRESIVKFCEQIGIYGKEEALNKCLQHALEKSQKREKKYQYLNCPDGFMWEEIKEIKNVGLQPTVCIEVDNTHTYLTEVYDHNSYLIGAIAFFYFITNLSDSPTNNTVIVITSVVFSQVKRSIFANLKHFAKQAEIYVKNRFGEEYSFLPKEFSDSPNTVEYWFDELNYIIGISTDNQNAISGIHATNLMILFDEAQGLSEQVFSGFRGVLQSGSTKLILLGNPTLPNGPTGEFFNAMQPESNYHKIGISAFDTPNFIETQIKLDNFLLPDNDKNNWRKKLDKYCGTDYTQSLLNDEVGKWEDTVIRSLPYPNLINPISAFNVLKDCGMNPQQYDFKTRILAEFPDGEGNCVFNQQWLDRSMTEYDNPEKHEAGTRSMGVDISQGLGRDFSTIAIRDGNKVIYLEEYQMNAPTFEQEIIEKYHEYGCEYCCIERDGVGKPIVDHLMLNENMVIVPINSGGGAGILEPISTDEDIKSKLAKEMYNCKRDELWFNVRDLLNPYNHQFPILLPKHNKLKRHLMSATWVKKRKIQVSPKEEMRKKIKESPDLADAVLFAFAPLGDADIMACYDYDFMTFKNTSWS